MKLRHFVPVTLVLALGCQPDGDWETPVADLTADLEALSLQVSGHEERISALEAADIALQAADAALDARVAAVEAAVADLATSASVAELRDALTTLDSEVATVAADLTAANERIDQVDEDLAAMESAIDELGTSLEATMDAADAALDADISAVDVRVTTLEDQQVPVGTIIDWYRPSASTAVPTGWALCDGSLSLDPASPFYGAYLPDLRGKFTRGVSDMSVNSDVGAAGGSDSHDHDTDTTHSHTGYTSTDGDHEHVSMTFSGASDTWYDGAGSGLPGANLSWSSHTSSSSVDHYVAIAAYQYYGPYTFVTDVSGDHDHSVTTYNGGGWVTSTSESNVPAYVGMVKLIRVR